MRLSFVPLLLAASAGAVAMAAEDDPFLWLEEVDGARALEWVHAQNDRSLDVLQKDERYKPNLDTALAIAQDKSRIPTGTLRAGWIYNFWQDDQNVRGIWRRTPLESYRTEEPLWQTVLDIDDLAKVEGKNWVFKGAECLPPAYRLCMVELSDGGKDASELREFDVETRAFVANGFHLPEAKSSVVWKDANNLLISTDWGPG